MRSFVLTLLLLSATVAANATDASSTSARADDDPNYAYAVSFSGGMVITRYAKPEFAQKLLPDRPDCVLLNWSLASQEESPTAKNEEVDGINTAIANATKTDSSAVLVISTVGQNRGLWVLYSAGGKSLAHVLEEQLQGRTKVPVVLRVVADAEWNGFRNYVTKLKQSE
jgi:hypothetical protein